ncbi:MAG: glutamyl-tRNA amidotransferase [Aeromicrobium sp.]|nr:MAG: glutamyl-tRNA amidotransferase [Aeromicrobium sp.]
MLRGSHNTSRSHRRADFDTSGHDGSVTRSGTDFDPTIWRRWDDPLVPAIQYGQLDGLSVAVKDIFAIAGEQTGFGNPAFLGDSPVHSRTAPAVQRFLDSGATVQGIAHMDEFAYSLDGVNAHGGSPPNPLGRDLISGGSSSGSASAVACGAVDIGLGTDTGGSIRIPAAYQGLFGLRPTHGAIDAEGVIPMAPSFDTVGLVARSADVLAAAGDVLLPASVSRGFSGLVTVDTLMGYADASVRASVAGFADSVGAQSVAWPEITLNDLSDYVTLQAFEVWQAHGVWVDAHWGNIGAAVRERFELAQLVTQVDADEARSNLRIVRERLIDWLADRVLILPTAPTLTPRVDENLARIRGQIQRLCCVSGIGGLPAVAVPLPRAGGLPASACFVAGPDRDRDLLALVQECMSSVPATPR